MLLMSMYLIIILQTPEGDVETAITENISEVRCELLVATIENNFDKIQVEVIAKLEAEGNFIGAENRSELIYVGCDEDWGMQDERIVH